MWVCTTGPYERVSAGLSVAIVRAFAICSRVLSGSLANATQQRKKQLWNPGRRPGATRDVSLCMHVTALTADGSREPQRGLLSITVIRTLRQPKILSYYLRMRVVNKLGSPGKRSTGGVGAPAS